MSSVISWCVVFLLQFSVGYRRLTAFFLKYHNAPNACVSLCYYRDVLWKDWE